MSWTDEDLKEINRLAYELETEVPEIGEIKKIQRKKIIIVDIEIGAEGYHGIAVAPIKADGTPDYHQIVIASKGTKVGANDETENALNGKFMEGGSKQTPVADAFVARVNAVEGHSVAKLTGHSQGSYMLKIGAKHQIPVTVFNGWFKYSNLTAEEAQFMQNNAHLFVNYRKGKDNVVFINDGNVPEDSDVFDTIVWVQGMSHSLHDWQFDQYGNVISTDSSQEQKKVRSYQISHAVALEKYRLMQLQSRLSQSGGGLSANEQIYLDESEALMTVLAMRNMLENTLQNVMKQYQTACDSIEQTWKDGVQIAQHIGNNLEDYEVSEALDLGGIDRWYVQGKN